MPRDPGQRLPDAPDPWAGSNMPASRSGPPWAMTEMIAAEPALVERLVARSTADPALARVADAIRAATIAGEPISVTGCGTSQHAALAIASLLRSALGESGQRTDGIRAVQAFELAGYPPPAGVVIAVSHEGGTDATNRALEHAGGRDRPTALITVSDRSPGAALARDLLTTGEQDQSWCHTVGYLSPLVVGVCLHAAIRGREPDAEEVRHQVAAGYDEVSAERLATALSSVERFLVVGSGADYAAARELALKIEEGVRLPAVAHELETIRHGHLGAATDRTGLVVIITDADGRGTELRDRAAAVLRSGAALDMPAVLIGSADVSDVADTGGLAAANCHLVPLNPGLDRLVAGILAPVAPLQLLTERLSRVHGTNPDTIGREDPRHAAAASA